MKSPAHGLKRAKANTTPQRLIVDQVLSMGTLHKPYIHERKLCHLELGKSSDTGLAINLRLFLHSGTGFRKINSYPTEIYGHCKFISLLLFKSNEPKTRIFL